MFSALFTCSDWATNRARNEEGMCDKVEYYTSVDSHIMIDEIHFEHFLWAVQWATTLNPPYWPASLCLSMLFAKWLNSNKTQKFPPKLNMMLYSSQSKSKLSQNWVKAESKLSKNWVKQVGTPTKARAGSLEIGFPLNWEVAVGL